MKSNCANTMVQSSPPKARSMNARTKTRRLTKIQERMRKVMFTPRVARLSRVGMVGGCWGWGWGCRSSADFVFLLLLFPDSSSSCSMLMFENRSRSRKKGGFKEALPKSLVPCFFLHSTQTIQPQNSLLHFLLLLVWTRECGMALCTREGKREGDDRSRKDEARVEATKKNQLRSGSIDRVHLVCVYVYKCICVRERERERSKDIV